MPLCPKCGKLNVDDATYCTNCGASLGGTSQSEFSGPFQSEVPTSSPSQPTASAQMPSNIKASELSQRLEKALRRTELLSYAAIGLSVLVLVIIIIMVYG